nr:MAG TPA: hypothetical protein [Caudoviricetes sp.]
MIRPDTGARIQTDRAARRRIGSCLHEAHARSQRRHVHRHTGNVSQIIYLNIIWRIFKHEFRIIDASQWLRNIFQHKIKYLAAKVYFIFDLCFQYRKVIGQRISVFNLEEFHNVGSKFQGIFYLSKPKLI